MCQQMLQLEQRQTGPLAPRPSQVLLAASASTTMDSSMSSSDSSVLPLESWLVLAARLVLGTKF